VKVYRHIPLLRLLPAVILAGLGLLHGAVHAQTESVIVKQASELRAAPGEGAAIEKLAAQTPLTRLGPRQGPWVQVRSAQNKTGWVHMFDIGTAGGASQGGNTATGGLRNVTNFLSKGTQNTTTTATSTVGIRGLGEEDLAKAQPNIRAVGNMEAHRVDAGSARQFAAGAQLVARQVDDLPEPLFGGGGSAPSGQGPRAGGEQ